MLLWFLQKTMFIFSWQVFSGRSERQSAVITVISMPPSPVSHFGEQMKCKQKPSIDSCWYSSDTYYRIVNFPNILVLCIDAQSNRLFSKARHMRLFAKHFTFDGTVAQNRPSSPGFHQCGSQIRHGDVATGCPLRWPINCFRRAMPVALSLSRC